MTETIDMVLKGVTWERCDGGEPRDAMHEGRIPYATHQGQGEMLGIPFRCYRLSDGRAVIHAEDMEAIIAQLLGDSKPE